MAKQTKKVEKVEVKEPTMFSKSDIVEQIANESEYMKSSISEMSNLIFDKITEHLTNGDSVQIYKFGTFSVKDTAARMGRNPSNGESIEIPAGKRVSFKFSNTVKKSVKSEE